MRVAHDDRWDLPLPSLAGTLAYLDAVSDALLKRLTSPLASEDDSYFYQLVTFHEDMHDEAFAYSRQTLGYPPPRFGPSEGSHDTTAGPLPGDVEVPGGDFVIGSMPGTPFVFDNEKWGHSRAVPPFRSARAPVTNQAFSEVLDDHRYDRQALWSQDGWA